MDFKGMFQETPAVEGNSFALVDIGEHEAELIDCKLDLTKNPERLTFVYEITDGDFKGRKLFGNYNLEGQGIGFLKKDLNTLGLSFEHVGSPEDIATLVWDAMPMSVVIYVAQKEWKGKMYNNVYLNSVLPDSAYSAAVNSGPKTPTNQKEADRQERVAQQPIATSKAVKTAPPATVPRTPPGTFKPAQTQRAAPPSGSPSKPPNRAPQISAKGRRAPAGEPDFGDDDSVPF